MHASGTRMTRFSSLLLALAAGAVSGCGQAGPDYDSLDLSTVQGTVTLDSAPLENALVLFEAEDETFSYGLTDNSGRYELMFNSRKAGCLKGGKTVRIWSSRGIPGAAEAGGGGEGDDPDGGEGEATGAAPAAAERVPAKYNAQSELTATVQNASETIDFDLRS